MISERWQQAVTELERRYPHLVVESLGGLCPMQASGTLHEYRFYLRYRHNYARLVVGVDDESLWLAPMWQAGENFGDDEDQGSLSTGELLTLFPRLIDNLRRAEIWWQFPAVAARRIGRIKVGDPDIVGAWGHTAADAWRRLHEPSPWLTARGISAQEQARLRQDQKIQPQTITVDTRVFPEIDPFTGAGHAG
jgi:hypothetical protein